MATKYYFRGVYYHSFADLCNAYKAAKGYLPLKPVYESNDVLFYE